jgi:3-oxoacyl-[acyl-carrier-protein] synthase III
MDRRPVHLEALGLHLPDEQVTSLALEERLEPLLARLGLSPGRLELMSGIRERRFFPPGTRPSAVAARAAEDALARSPLDRGRIGMLIHGSVCRDFLEPATASVVHRALGLPPTCQAFDLSNACLGVLDGMALAADAIAAGTIEAALVVTGEDGRPLVERTLQDLLSLEDDRAARRALKTAYASLTIGSGAAAVLLAAEDLASSPHRWRTSVARADTDAVELCSGDHAAGGGLQMETDSEALLQAGNALASRTFGPFLEAAGWAREDLQAVVTHQVGSAHRRLLYETLELELDLDFPTVTTLGNMGSASLPATLALAAREGFLDSRSRVALLGIGSGLHCRMAALDWNPA